MKEMWPEDTISKNRKRTPSRLEEQERCWQMWHITKESGTMELHHLRIKLCHLCIFRPPLKLPWHIFLREHQGSWCCQLACSQQFQVYIHWCPVHHDLSFLEETPITLIEAVCSCSNSKGGHEKKQVRKTGTSGVILCLLLFNLSLTVKS